MSGTTLQSPQGRHGRPAVLVALVLALACGGGEGTDPSGEPPIRSLVLGDTVAGDIPPAGRVFYRLNVPTDTVIAVFGQGLVGGYSVTVRHLGTGSLVGFGQFVLDPAAEGLTREVRIGPAIVPAGSLELEITKVLGPANGRFRMVVFGVNPGPETAPRVFSAGDTLTGESFAHPGDIDTYELQAPPGATMALLLHFREYFLLAIKGVTVGYDLGGRYSPDSAPDALLRRRSDHFIMPASGKVTVEVRPQFGPVGGPYRIWAYQVNRGPEHVAATLAIGDTLRGEVLENIADIDEFTIPLSTSRELIAYLGNPGPGLSQPVALGITGAGINGSFTVNSAEDSAGLEDRNSGIFQPPTPGTLKLTLFTNQLGALTGPAAALRYAAQVREIVRAPEHVPVMLTPGDTLVGEAIDYVGDIDEFLLPVTAGQKLDAFVHAGAGRQGAYASLDVFSGPTQLAQRAVSGAGDSAMAEHETGVFTATQTELLTVRVAAGGLGRLDYRIFPYLIDTLPEHVPALVAMNDTVSAEILDYPGDEDHFLLVRPAIPDALVVFLERPSPPIGGVAMTLPGSQGIGCYPQGLETEVSCGSGLLWQPTDTMPAMVSGGGSPRYYGSYRFFSFASDKGVEQGAGGVASGTSTTGTIEVPGDLDTYTLDYQRGELLEFRILATGPVAAGGSLTDSVGTNFYIAAVGNVGTGRFDLPRSGRYLLRASLAGAARSDTGAFTIQLDSVPRTPETASQVLVPDAAPLLEAYDWLGDVDEYALSALPGTELQILASLPGWGNTGLHLFLPGDSLPFKDGTTTASGRFLMPAGGHVVVRAAEDRLASVLAPEGSFTGAGPYQIQARTVNRAPETRPAAVAVGDTIAQETIDFVGDIDEFTFPGIAGQSVNLGIASFGPYLPSDVVMELFDPSGMTLLGTAAAYDRNVVVTGSIILPATGTYLLRLRCQSDLVGSGTYRVTFEP